MRREFFDRPTPQVARELIGMRLARVEDGQRICGVILEAEAYRGEEDQACHARAGRTPRTQVMYGPPGHAYVYFTYGMHWMLNFVTEAEGFPAAVLVRAVQITEGKELVARRRGRQPAERWTDGPAKVCQALHIDRAFNGYDLCAPGAALRVEAPPTGEELALDVCISPRVGLNATPEPWKSIAWRFYARPGEALGLRQGVRNSRLHAGKPS
ncbi:MAG: DNA-3-methyladenine glycosylase [Anaerolineales bacterium]|nr:DNA-3-methyladenine glycosylase [Anaerolineales bacterium]